MAENDVKTTRGLSPRERHIAVLIAGGATHAAAATAIGKSENTIYRTMQRPEVRREVDSIRGMVVDGSLGVLVSSLRTAAEELAVMAKAGTPTDSVRLAACRTIIESVLKVREVVEFERRIATLEDRLKGENHEQRTDWQRSGYYGRTKKTGTTNATGE